jgi:hypothetical protein
MADLDSATDGMKAVLHRKRLLLLAALLAAASLSPIGYEEALTAKLRAMIAAQELPYRYRYLGNGLFELTDTITHTARRLLVADYRPVGGLKPKKIQTIDLRTVDTTGFAAMFETVGTLPLGTSSNTIIGIEGKSKNKYFIGTSLQNGSYAGTVAYSIHIPDFSFSYYRLYDSTIPFNPVQSCVAYHADTPHLMGDWAGRTVLLSSKDSCDIPNKPMGTRDGRNSIFGYPRIYDIDNDANDEILLRNDVILAHPYIFVAKYDSADNAYADPYASDLGGVDPYESFAVGDFDADGNREFASSALYGYVNVVECNARTHTYRIIFSDVTRSGNGGFNVEGTDIDQDGRNEFIIGSLVTGMANLAFYEPTADDSFEVSLWLELKGAGAISNGLTIGDIDGDARDEVVMWSGNSIIILRSDGDDSYSVLWTSFMYRREVCVSLYDIDSDNRMELLISHSSATNILDGVTDVLKYRQQPTTFVSSPALTKSPSLSLWPHPATSNVEIAVRMKPGEWFSLDLYDSRGQQIRNIYHGRAMSGETLVVMSRETLAGGIYFIRLTSQHGHNTRKLLLFNMGSTGG